MRYRLLAAEDEPQLRMMLWDYFTAKDFDVTTCRDGEEALAKLEEQAFDIVFLDIMMPKLDGLTVCRALRRGESRASHFPDRAQRRGKRAARLRVRRG